MRAEWRHCWVLSLWSYGAARLVLGASYLDEQCTYGGVPEHVNLQVAPADSGGRILQIQFAHVTWKNFR